MYSCGRGPVRAPHAVVPTDWATERASQPERERWCPAITRAQLDLDCDVSIRVPVKVDRAGRPAGASLFPPIFFRHTPYVYQPVCSDYTFNLYRASFSAKLYFEAPEKDKDLKAFNYCKKGFEIILAKNLLRIYWQKRLVWINLLGFFPKR